MKKIEELNRKEKIILARNYLDSHTDLADNKSYKKMFWWGAAVLSPFLIGLSIILYSYTASFANAATFFICPCLVASVPFIGLNIMNRQTIKNISNGMLSCKEFKKLLKDKEFQEILAGFFSGKTINEISTYYSTNYDPSIDIQNFDALKNQIQSNINQNYTPKSHAITHNTSKNQQDEREF